ncbi:HNH endonuclease [Staphylococcus phage vB_SauH_DELF3]|nr:HNH endonuclease [Staphylococcus phage vB_SauH_DELF3]
MERNKHNQKMLVGVCGYCGTEDRTIKKRKNQRLVHAKCKIIFNCRPILNYSGNSKPIYKHLNGELWPHIIGYEGLGVNKKYKILDIRDDKRKLVTVEGDTRICLETITQIHRFLVHRLVAEDFTYNIDPKEKTQFTHKIHLKSDNRVENLEWATHCQNILYNFKFTTREPLKGIENGKVKSTEKNSIHIYKNSSDSDIKKLAKLYNVPTRSIDIIRYKKGWTHITPIVDKGEIYNYGFA